MDKQSKETLKQSTQKPLSDARIKEIADSLDIEDDYYDYNLARAIEVEHGIK